MGFAARGGPNHLFNETTDTLKERISARVLAPNATTIEIDGVSVDLVENIRFQSKSELGDILHRGMFAYWEKPETGPVGVLCHTTSKSFSSDTCRTMFCRIMSAVPGVTNPNPPTIAGVNLKLPPDCKAIRWDKILCSAGATVTFEQGTESQMNMRLRRELQQQETRVHKLQSGGLPVTLHKRTCRVGDAQVPCTVFQQLHAITGKAFRKNYRMVVPGPTHHTFLACGYALAGAATSFPCDDLIEEL